MNVLIVDDDRFIVSALKARIDWGSLGIDKVLQAYNIRQAQKIFQEQRVDILISDIRMPQGSGLDLLAWAREQKLDVEAIFLTNYAQFHYAQKALELQSLDFILKPVAFEKFYPVLKKAADKVNARREYDMARQTEENKLRLKDHFWHHLLTGAFTGGEAVEKAARESLLPYEADDCFLPVLIRAFDPPGSMGDARSAAFADLIPHAFSLMAGMLPLALVHVSGSVFPKCAVLVLDQTGRAGCQELIRHFTAMQTRLKDMCGLDFEVLIGGHAPLPELYGLVKRMRSESLMRLNGRNRTTLYTAPAPPLEYPPPDMEEMSRALNNLDVAGLGQKVSLYLTELKQKAGLSAPVMRVFRLDFFQMVLSFLHGKNIEAHKLFEGEEYTRLEQNAMESVEDLMCYLQYLTDRAVAQVQLTGRPKSVTDALIQYITKNLDKNLSRLELAGYVYLNADYMARIFKKETGISLGQFIRDRRVEAAKQRLSATGEAVRDIAGKVGYDNYSLFTKTFREATGVTPMEYRRNCRQGK